MVHDWKQQSFSFSAKDFPFPLSAVQVSRWLLHLFLAVLLLQQWLWLHSLLLQCIQSLYAEGQEILNVVVVLFVLYFRCVLPLPNLQFYLSD